VLARGCGGVPCAAMTVAARAEEVRTARMWVVAALQGWGLCALVDDCRVVTSELVTNAVGHACGPTVGVAVEVLSRQCVRLAVTDASWQWGAGVQALPTAESGRGLPLVAALSVGVGVVRTPAGKTVWADVSAGGGRALP
jgi:anti-sigma regulatory factor (Ser/Thr protein kinase)